MSNREIPALADEAKGKSENGFTYMLGQFFQGARKSLTRGAVAQMLPETMAAAQAQAEGKTKGSSKDSGRVRTKYQGPGSELALDVANCGAA